MCCILHRVDGASGGAEMGKTSKISIGDGMFGTSGVRSAPEIIMCCAVTDGLCCAGTVFRI